jgi:hypothetical protein
VDEFREVGDRVRADSLVDEIVVHGAAAVELRRRMGETGCS